jgi:lysozyme
MKHNREDFEGAAEEFLKWDKAGGKVLKGLDKRRRGEKALYES